MSVTHQVHKNFWFRVEVKPTASGTWVGEWAVLKRDGRVPGEPSSRSLKSGVIEPHDSEGAATAAGQSAALDFIDHGPASTPLVP